MTGKNKSNRLIFGDKENAVILKFRKLKTMNVAEDVIFGYKHAVYLTKAKKGQKILTVGVDLPNEPQRQS